MMIPRWFRSIRSARSNRWWQAAAFAGLLALAGPAVALDQSKTPAKELFGAAGDAAPLSPRAYGFYNRGCLAGAAKLPENGVAWQAMRLKRNRNWGHPELVELVKTLAVEAREAGDWPGLLVGDLAQPRGGPMLFGHASHQIGLDADIWLTPMPEETLTIEERETMSAISVINNRKTINPEVWSEAHAKLIRRAASYRQVARIFVHPPIKKALCDWAPRDESRAWLKKVRPYYGHHYHFHIRINCPRDSRKGCRNQPAPAPKDGTGCGGELAYWYSDKPWAPKKKSTKAAAAKKFVDGVPLPRPRPKVRPAKPVLLAKLPKACRKVLNAK